MPSAYSPLLRFEEQNPGEGLNVWGNKLNTDTIAIIDFAIAGYTALTISGPITLTTANGAADQARSAILDFTSGTGGTVTIPSVSHVYGVRNNTSGNVVFTTGSGTTATVEPGNLVTVICDGTNCYRFADAADIATCLATSKAYTDAAAFSSASGNLPGQAGNAGRFLQTNGTTPTWVSLTSGNITTALGYTPQIALGYTPLNAASNLSDVGNVGSARANLGLGTAATANTGTSGATVPLLSTANTWTLAQTFTLAPVFTNQSGSRTALGLGTVATANTGTSGANVPLLNGVNTWSGDQTFAAGAQTTPSVVAFSASAMALNCALSNVFSTTFTANVTSAPTISNPGDGQTINWFITQDGTGSRTMTWPTSFKWPGASAGVLSTGANAVDLLVATYRASTGFWYATLLQAFG